MEFSPETLYVRRKTWDRKPIMRRLYGRWYRAVVEALKTGNVVELGSGSGNAKEFVPQAIVTDILSVPWLDAVHDAQALPFREESIDNLVLFDVLHHLASPYAFFLEAQRVLKNRGRIILWEPYVSLSSYLIYRFFHGEGLHWHDNPFRKGVPLNGTDARGENLAMSNLIFEKRKTEFERLFPRLRIVRQEKTDFLQYPLSGGFHHPSLLPQPLLNLLDSAEILLTPLRRLMAFRVFVVIEKNA